MILFKNISVIGLFLLLVSSEKTINDDIIISNCNIIDIKSGEILKNKDIWIKNDRIQLIEEHKTNTNGHFIINATDKYIIPGLWDMHAHIVDFDWVLDLYTALGVTGLRVMHGNTQRIEDINKNRIDGFYQGFEFLYSSPITDGPGGNWPGSRVVSTPEEGRQIVRKYAEKGYDFVKIYHRINRETYFAIVDECKKLNIDFAGHVPNKLTTKEVIKAGQKSIEHWLGVEHALSNPKIMEEQFSNYKNYGHFKHDFLMNYDRTLVEKVIEITKTDSTWFCPTLVVEKNNAYYHSYDSIFRSDERLKYIPKEEQEYWFGDNEEEGAPSYLSPLERYREKEIAFFNLNLSYLKPMLDNGSRFLAGTDTSNPNVYPGFSLHEELQLFVEAGFTELEALQTATLNPAIFTDRLDELGTVEEGKLANLIILDKNPLENIKNTLTINGLIRRGEYLNRDSLKKLLNHNKN